MRRVPARSEPIQRGKGVNLWTCVGSLRCKGVATLSLLRKHLSREEGDSLRRPSSALRRKGGGLVLPLILRGHPACGPAMASHASVKESRDNSNSLGRPLRRLLHGVAWRHLRGGAR